ncbi:hypothetical protein DVH24_024417 [Malus domestica]|uniref:Reticulon-like protein n=1 Tax=Malus domestica TaxID=3750 RepID=A0A498JLP8_MALDO|nr:hypothetical protein DVH24_024417 [Malus domestica]
MENSQELCSTEGDGDGRKAVPSTSYTAASCGAAYRLFGRQESVHNCLGGGRVYMKLAANITVLHHFLPAACLCIYAYLDLSTLSLFFSSLYLFFFLAADILLWKRGRVSFGTIIVATVSWLVFERSGLSFLSICADVLLILVVLLFLCANYADFRNKQLQTLPELVVSEEMVHNVAASFRVKINNVLLMAHDITLGKDFRLFFKVVVCLWLLSVIGSFFSFFTLAYIAICNVCMTVLPSRFCFTIRSGLNTFMCLVTFYTKESSFVVAGSILSITLPALYSKYEETVDRCCGKIHRQFSKHYKIVDDGVFNKLPRNTPLIEQIQSSIYTGAMSRSRLDTILSTFVVVHPHEISALLHSSSCFFFVSSPNSPVPLLNFENCVLDFDFPVQILCAYFVVLPLRDEGAISLGLSNLPSLFVGSLVLTSIAAPVATLIFSLPNVSKGKALVLMLRFFSVSLVAFFFLWRASSAGSQAEVKGLVSIDTASVNDEKVVVNQAGTAYSVAWENLGRLYVSVRIALFLWIALLNLITISSTWARIIDVMDFEMCIQSGSRLFGFIGAGATLGQLFGSLFATGMARESDPDRKNESDGQTMHNKGNSPKSPTPVVKPQMWTILDGFWLILSSSYLLYVSLFLWLSAVISSFFYFQKVSVIAMTVTTSLGRRKLLAQINSFIAVFILAGQLTITGRFLTIVGVTTAICAAPFVAFLNLVAIAVWPTWVAIAVFETLRKFVTYVLTRPGRELLFTVVSQDEKYKAKARVCIDVFVQRLGDATAAGMYKLLFSTLNGRAPTVSLYGLPVAVKLNSQNSGHIPLPNVS